MKGLDGSEYDEYLGDLECPEYDGTHRTALYACRTCGAVIADSARHRALAHPDEPDEG